MKNLVSLAGGLLAGAAAMYYLDSRNGARRRALVRDKLLAAGHDVADVAQAKGKRVTDKVKGVMATGRLDGETRSTPETDHQLHERIRSRMGHVASHPKAIHVDVDQGNVRLTGDILARELDKVLAEVRGVAGVRAVRNELNVHDSADHIAALQGDAQPAGQKQEPARTSW
jgi:osmotically-inducible protein OsmY